MVCTCCPQDLNEMVGFKPGGEFKNIRGKNEDQLIPFTSTYSLAFRWIPDDTWQLTGFRQLNITIGESKVPTLAREREEMPQGISVLRSMHRC